MKLQVNRHKSLLIGLQALPLLRILGKLMSPPWVAYPGTESLTQHSSDVESIKNVFQTEDKA
jgi:hypothetical protein